MAFIMPYSNTLITMKLYFANKAANMIKIVHKTKQKLDNAKPLLGENVAAAHRHLEIVMTSFFQRLRWPNIVGT